MSDTRYLLTVDSSPVHGLSSLHLDRNYHIFKEDPADPLEPAKHRSIHDLSPVAYHPNLTHFNLEGSPRYSVDGAEAIRDLAPLIHTRKMKWIDLSGNKIQGITVIDDNDSIAKGFCDDFSKWNLQPCQRRYGELRELRYMNDLQTFIARDADIQYFNQRLDTLDRQCTCGEHKDFKMDKPLKIEITPAPSLVEGVTENVEIVRMVACHKEGEDWYSTKVVGTISHEFQLAGCNCGYCDMEKLYRESIKYIEKSDINNTHGLLEDYNHWASYASGDPSTWEECREEPLGVGLESNCYQKAITEIRALAFEEEDADCDPEDYDTKGVKYFLRVKQGDSKPAISNGGNVCRIGVNASNYFTYGPQSMVGGLYIQRDEDDWGPDCSTVCEDNYASAPFGVFDFSTVGQTATPFSYEISFPSVGAGEALKVKHYIEVQYDNEILRRFYNNKAEDVIVDSIPDSSLSPYNLTVTVRYRSSDKRDPVTKVINLQTMAGEWLFKLTDPKNNKALIELPEDAVFQTGPYNSFSVELVSISPSTSIFKYPYTSKIPAYIKSVSIKDLTVRIGNGTSCENNEVLSKDLVTGEILKDPQTGENIVTETCKCDIYRGECDGTKKFEGDLAEQWPALEYLDLSGNPLTDRVLWVAHSESETPDGAESHYCKVINTDPPSIANAPFQYYVGKYDGFTKFKLLKGLFLEDVDDSAVISGYESYLCDRSAGNVSTLLPQMNTLKYLDMSHVYQSVAAAVPDLRNMQLQELDISGNNFHNNGAAFNRNLGGQYELEYLDMGNSANPITGDFAFLYDMQNLRYLDLTGMLVTDDIMNGFDIAHFGRLEYLDLSETSVETLQWLAATPEVQYLYVNGNGLYDIESLDYLARVEEMGIAEHCIVKEGENNSLEIDTQRITDHTESRVVHLEGDDTMNAVCNGVQTTTAVCGNGISGELMVLMFQGEPQLVPEACDTESRPCKEFKDTNQEPLYNVGWAYCTNDCLGWDMADCDMIDPEDIEPEEEQPTGNGVLACANGISATALDGKNFCLCNDGYYSVGTRCIKESVHSTGTTDAATAQEKSGTRTDNSSYVEERVETTGDPIDIPEIVDSAGCSYPTVESCFSELYQRSSCGQIFRGVCRDMMRICLFVGDRCCIPKKDGEGNLMNVCDPKFDGLCKRQNDSETGALLCSRTPDNTDYLGCVFTSNSTDSCKAKVSSCTLEDTGHPCATDEDCGCFGENCTYTCRDKAVGFGTERFCMAITCDSSNPQPTEPDQQCGRIMSPSGSRALCVPKDIAEEMALIGDDETGQCIYPEREDLTIDGNDALNIEMVCQLPDPVLKYDKECATFIGCLQNEQAKLHNIVRFNTEKLPEGGDPAKNKNYTDSINGEDDSQLSFLGSFPTGGKRPGDESGNDTKDSEGNSADLTCALYGIGTNCNSGGITIYSETLPGYQVDLGSSNSQATSYKKASGSDGYAGLTPTLTNNILARAFAGVTPIEYCNEPLTNCRDYATKKYIDVVNAMRLAAIYEDTPIEGIHELFNRLPLYNALGESVSDNTLVFAKAYRAGNQYETLKKTSLKTGIRRSGNLFHEVAFYMSKTAEFASAEGAHIRNGLFMRYDPAVTMYGGVNITDPSVSDQAADITAIFSGATLCTIADPNTDSSGAQCGSRAPLHSFANYYELFGTDTGLAENEYKSRIITLLKDRMVELLLARANIEELWQERKEDALRMNPADASIYGVSDITRKTKALLANLTIYREYADINTVSDITDPEILRLRQAGDITEEKAIKDARIKRFNDLQAKLETDIRTTRYEDSPEAQRLWRDHYPRTRYYLDEMSAAKRATLTQDERKELYPNGETEWLIENVLLQIDLEIQEILLTAAGKAITGYNTSYSALNCFDPGTTGQSLDICSAEPSFFLKKAVNIVPPEALETAYQDCVSATNNDANAFGVPMVDGTTVGGYLRNTTNLWVFEPKKVGGWGEVLKAINNEGIYASLEKSIEELEGAIREYQDWQRNYKKIPPSIDGRPENYFKFQSGVEVFEKNEENIYENKWVPAEEPLTVSTVEFSKCFFDYSFYEMRALNVLNRKNSGAIGGAHCNDNITSIDHSDWATQPTTWQCFDFWNQAYAAYLEEVQAVQDKMSVASAELKLKQAEMAARKLKKGGLLNPPAAEEAGTTNPKPRNPFAIPTQLEKWFSDYRQFGVDDLNANFTYIAGAGVKNLILDPNKYNPMPYMTDFHAFLPHLGKALLKHVDEGALNDAIRDNPQLVELASLQLGQWMYNNLKNMKKLEQMYTNAMKQVQQFDLAKLRGLMNGKGLGGIIDEEKILEIVADELMKEIITRAYADGTLTAGTNGATISNPADILDILKTGANFSVEAEMFSMAGTVEKANDVRDKPQEYLLYLEQQRQQIESVVRGYESTMQGNVNIIRNEIKAKYGAIDDFAGLIEMMTKSGNPAQALVDDLIGDSIMELFIGQLMSGELILPADLIFTEIPANPPNSIHDCSNMTAQECLAEIGTTNITKLQICGDVACESPQSIRDFIVNNKTDLGKIAKMALDYKRILRQAVLGVGLDYMMQALRVPNENAVMLRQLITTLMEAKSSLNCLPAFDGAQLKCGETAIMLDGNVALTTGAVQTNLMDAVKGIFESALSAHKNGYTPDKLMAVTASYIDHAFFDNIPMLKNRGNPDVMKLRLILSDFVAKSAYITWRTERLINRIIDFSNGEYTTTVGTTIPSSSGALGSTISLNSLQPLLEEQGKQLLQKLVTKAASCATQECNVNDFLTELNIFGNFGDAETTLDKIHLPDLGEVMNTLMKNGATGDTLLFLNESKADLLDIYGLSAGLLSTEDLSSATMLTGYGYDSGTPSPSWTPASNDTLSDVLGTLKNGSAVDTEDFKQTLAGITLSDSVNLIVSVFSKAGISAIGLDYSGLPSLGGTETPSIPDPDLSGVWDDLSSSAGSVNALTMMVVDRPNITDLGFDSLGANDSSISFPSLNFGHLKGAVEGTMRQMLAPALSKIDAYKTSALDVVELGTPEYWTGLINQMTIPGFDPTLMGKINDIKTQLNALKTATSETAITQIKFGTSGDGGIAGLFNEIKDYDDPIQDLVLPVETVQKISYAIPQILIDPNFYQRVIKRIANETAIIAAFKEVFNGASSDPISWLKATTTTGVSSNPTLPSLVGVGLEPLGVSTLNDLIPDTSTADFMAILADAVIMRAEEVFMKELFKLPFAEVAMHTSAGLHLFTFDADLFEATFYVTTRLDRDRYGRIIDLESVHPKARDKFIKRYDKKVEKFKPYTKYYFFAAMTSFDDLAETAVEAGKKAMKEAAEAAINTGVAKLQDEVDKQMEAISTDVKNPEDFGSKIAKDPKLEDFKFAELEESGTVNFQIGPVPAYLTYGFTFDAGIRYGIDYNYGWFRGLTVGASAGPYIVTGAFLEVGAGFDYEWISFQIGIGGHVDIFDFYAPLKVQGMLKPELDLDGVGVKFYLATSLEPELKLLAGYVYVKAKGHIGIDPLAIKFNLKRTIFEWDPLIDMKFGNLIPLKPLKIDLFSIGEGVKLLGKEM